MARAYLDLRSPAAAAEPVVHIAQELLDEVLGHRRQLDLHSMQVSSGNGLSAAEQETINIFMSQDAHKIPEKQIPQWIPHSLRRAALQQDFRKDCKRSL